MTVYDVAYSLGLGLAAPYWLLKTKARRQVLPAFRERMGNPPPRADDRPVVLIHAVSLGEINATPKLVRFLTDARPDLRILVTSTSDTGFARAQKLYGATPDVTVAR